MTGFACAAGASHGEPRGGRLFAPRQGICEQHRPWSGDCMSTSPQVGDHRLRRRHPRPVERKGCH
jgi:hypothetical protein